MFEWDFERVFRDLGSGHRFAPGEEPVLFEKILAYIYSYEIGFYQVLWFVIFLCLIYLLVRSIRYFWRLARSRRPEDEAVEMDQFDGDRRRQHLRRLRVARTHETEADPRYAAQD